MHRKGGKQGYENLDFHWAIVRETYTVNHIRAAKVSHVRKLTRVVSILQENPIKMHPHLHFIRGEKVIDLARALRLSERGNRESAFRHP